MKNKDNNKKKKNEDLFLEEIKERLFNSEFKKINMGDLVRALAKGSDLSLDDLKIKANKFLMTIIALDSVMNERDPKEVERDAGKLLDLDNVMLHYCEKIDGTYLLDLSFIDRELIN